MKTLILKDNPITWQVSDVIAEQIRVCMEAGVSGNRRFMEDGADRMLVIDVSEIVEII